MNAETILVAEANAGMGELISREILPSLGFKSLWAQDGEAAMGVIRSRPVSLMLLDLHLPDCDSLDLLRKLVREGYFIPTILTASEESEQVTLEIFRLGVRDYLTKPIEAYKLGAAVHRVLRGNPASWESVVPVELGNEPVSWLTVLSKIGQSSSSTLELSEILNRIVQASVSLTQAEEGFLALVDENSGRLTLRASKNIDQEVIETMRLTMNDALLGQALRTGNPQRIAAGKQGTLLKVSTGFLVYSLLHVPILWRGKALGVLSVDNRLDQRTFSKIDEALLISLAGYAASAIENARLLRCAQEEIDERREVEQALRESEDRFALAVRGANDGLWDWDLKLDEVFYSPRWKSMLGYGEDEIGNAPDEWFSRVSDDDLQGLWLDISSHLRGMTSHFENEHRMLHKDGSYRWMLSRGIAIWDEDKAATRMAGSQTDITDRKIAEQRLLHDAFHDTLTGLPNRALFMDRLGHAVERSKRREDFMFAVLFLDLDRFKDINDSLGHMVGDELLVAVANTLREGLRATDTVARLGGDEFVILLEDISGVNGAIRIAEWVHESLTEPFKLRDREVFVTTSVGIVLSATGYQQPEDVLRDADIAMYSAKANGRARYGIFDPSMRERIMRRVVLETDLRQAIENQEFRVYYQPIVSLTSGELTGFEALVRWQHPERGLLFPVEFLPLAEESGLIISLDRWVLEEACRQIQEWQDVFPERPNLTVSVNLSGKQVAQPDLVEEVARIIKETGLSPRSLKLEITENAIMENNQFTAGVFAKLQALGVEIQIDDFGVGYSSLGYLSHFPINALKIDRTFVGMMAKDGHQHKIVQAIVTLTHRLGVGVIAEGVETEGQLNQLRALGCEYGQGFLVSEPMTREAAVKILKKAGEGGSLLEKRKTG
jgi:diguanylate cyclase (GGDEF)-like protein/PAS domain S-box-containing protein